MPAAKQNSSSLAAFVKEPHDGEVIKEVSEALKLKDCEIVQGGIKEAIKAFSQKKSPQFLLVDITDSELPVSDLSKLFEICEPGVGIIALGSKNDVFLY